MSNPNEYQPFSQPEPWQGPQDFPSQSPQSQAPQSQAPWQQSSAMPKQSNVLAITALVIAGLALLMSSGGLFASVVLGGVMSSFPGGMGGIEGTAPQVVSGQAYPGKLLQDEVTRVAGNNIGDVTSMSCPATPAVVADAVTTCQGTVDGSDMSLKVTFHDSLGHFALDQKVN